MSESLTPDITIRGRLPTKEEYAAHLRLLEDAAHDEKRGRGTPRIYRNWLSKDMSDLEHEVWVAVHREGLMRQEREGYHRLTTYGHRYLEQRRRSAARDLSHRRRWV